MKFIFRFNLCGEMVAAVCGEFVVPDYLIT